MRKLVGVICIVGTLFGSNVVNAANTQTRYGEWHIFRLGHSLEYADFKLQFLRKDPGGFYPGSNSRRLGDVYYFEAIESEKVVPIEWSAGTGLIGPRKFQLKGKTYLIEMVRSDVIGPASLPQEQVAVTEENDWKAKLEERRHNKTVN